MATRGDLVFIKTDKHHHYPYVVVEEYYSDNPGATHYEGQVRIPTHYLIAGESGATYYYPADYLVVD